MPKKVIPLVTDEMYHVYNRGVDKREVFLDDFYYIRFYQSLIYFNTVDANLNFRLAKSRHSDSPQPLVKVHAYALLPNHYHLILEQVVDGGISEYMKRVSAGYTGYFNEKNNRSGSLFQGPFKRVRVENDSYFNYLLAYVNENHAVHNTTIKRQLYHSSSLHYQGLQQSKLINQKISHYSASEAVRLAKDIYKKRNNYNFILE